MAERIETSINREPRQTARRFEAENVLIRLLNKLNVALTEDYQYPIDDELYALYLLFVSESQKLDEVSRQQLAAYIFSQLEYYGLDKGQLSKYPYIGLIYSQAESLSMGNVLLM